MLNGCQGRDKTPTLSIKTCPQCGSDVEVFSTDNEIECPNCGTMIYNDVIDCVSWCKYAKLCMGNQAYRDMLERLERIDSKTIDSD